MDYKLAKLKEMNTWSEINELDVPADTQILPGMWVLKSSHAASISISTSILHQSHYPSLHILFAASTLSFSKYSAELLSPIWSALVLFMWTCFGLV